MRTFLWWNLSVLSTRANMPDTFRGSLFRARRWAKRYRISFPLFAGQTSLLSSPDQEKCTSESISTTALFTPIFNALSLSSANSSALERGFFTARLLDESTARRTLITRLI
jgi:hypothetical protein